MWTKKHILYQALCSTLTNVCGCVCVCSACWMHTSTHLFPDLKSAVTTGVPVETGPLCHYQKFLPLLGLYYFLTEINQTVASQLIMCFEGTPTVHIKCMHSQAQIYKHKQKAWKQYVSPHLMFFDGKQSAKTERNHLTEISMEALYFWHLWVRQCYWSFLWRQRQNNNQGLLLK